MSDYSSDANASTCQEASDPQATKQEEASEEGRDFFYFYYTDEAADRATETGDTATRNSEASRRASHDGHSGPFGGR